MDKDQKNSALFRDRISTMDDDGKRIWISPKKPKGRLHRYRTIVSWVLLAVLFITPFVKINGQPLLLLDIIHRRFFFFGFGFWPQDAPIFVFATLVIIIFIVLFTVVFGRIWCGWACPQTIFMEMVFRKIEYWIEGTALEQRKLNQAPMDGSKFLKKSGKHFVFFILSFLFGNMFLTYFIGVEELYKIVSEPVSQHVVGFIAMLLFTGAFYYTYAFFREQVCTLVCPYGRLQGVLLDRKTIVVAYDFNRGEPRGTKSEGDCIDCNHCVDVCPTGIDIRNGTQLECVNCTACIDACNNIMDKVKKPLGLIRYDSFDGIEKGQKLRLNSRNMGYSLVLLILIGIFITLLALRAPVETSILRTPGVLYQELDDGFISNLYNIKIINKTFENKSIYLHLVSPMGVVEMVGGDLTVPSGGLCEGAFFVKLDKKLLKVTSTPLEIEVSDKNQILETIETTFLGPNPYLKR